MQLSLQANSKLSLQKNEICILYFAFQYCFNFSFSPSVVFNAEKLIKSKPKVAANKTGAIRKKHKALKLNIFYKVGNSTKQLQRERHSYGESFVQICCCLMSTQSNKM